MARSGEVYGGAWGRTRTEALHVTCPCGTLYAADVHRSINATRDPALGARLREGALGETRCPDCGATTRVEVSVIYHDELRRLFLLVLPDGLRHRELEERADLYLALAREKGFAVPGYVRDFRAVFAGPELQRALEPPGDSSSDRRLDARAAELDRREAELDRRARELGSDDAGQTVGEPEAEPIDDSQIFGELPEGGQIHTVIEESTHRFGLGDVLPAGGRDAAIARWQSTRQAAGHTIEGGDVRLLLRSRPAGGSLHVRVLLARLPTYPLLILAVGPGGLGDEVGEPLATILDLERPEDRQALGILAASFHLLVDFHDDGYQPLGRREVILPLAANVRYALALADEHLAHVPAPRRSFETAAAAWRTPGFDRWGRRDPRLDEDSFSILSTPAAGQKALGVVAGWSEPDNEDYLLLTRSFPVEWWRRIRARVIHRGVELGLVLPGLLVEVAVSEGLYRSRKELVTRTLASFAELLADRAGDNDLDGDQLAANWRALLSL
ncbi:MAG TPA: CpXC domain-containing protein, partial [Planctomycetota bacterium]|nr:CpXC domain-containing protein [Planctomycetota bacterium]